MANDEWQTPQDLFDKLDKEFNFGFDVACTENNCICAMGIAGKYEDALEADWVHYTWYDEIDVCWMNPPYSRGNIDKFAKKAFEESQRGCIVVGLVRCDPSTIWFQKYVFGKAHEVRMLTRRVKFINPETGKPEQGYNFPCCVVVWKPRLLEETKFSMFDW